ncbi:site-specific integrase [Caballeronia novacaledonica]|uniref:Site-specific integrase n=1 Tax=Caballeronia novacaledonica TaxID=1544861 RepID=A0AA37MRH5_9BURK|nr:site-specific integrase [Caballeronia novacaledonica]GJH28141.1 site-specific integrase [Caballeronia novacaledonica]
MAENLTTKKLAAQPAGKKVLSDIATPGLRYLASDKKAGEGKWVFRYTSPETGARRDIGLGSFPSVPPTRAREKVRDIEISLRAGRDPLEVRTREKQAAEEAESEAAKAPTFEKIAREVYEKRAPKFSNAKHRAQWISTLETYAFPHIGSMRVRDVRTKHIAQCLEPIWFSKPETASRVKQRLEVVFRYAVAHEYADLNPVPAIADVLDEQDAKVEHQPAMAFQAIPAFMAEHVRTRKPSDTVRAALELLILTAARSGEIRGAMWTEFNLASGVWTVPAERMKMRVEHIVPLPRHAVDMLRDLKAAKLHDELVFPSPRGKVLSDMTITALLRRVEAKSTTAGRVATAHGFRSSFRDWLSENGYSRELAERALAHQVANAVERAYLRTKLAEQRRPMMQAWSDYLDNK